MALNFLDIIQISKSNFLSSFLFYRNYFSAAYSSYTGHIWSLAIEEHFYLFWPFIIFYLSEKNLKKFIWLIILISPILRIMTYWKFPEARQRQDIMTHCRLDGFMFGALLALEYSKDQFSDFKSYFKFPRFTLSGLILIYCLIHPIIKYHSLKGYWIIFGLSLNALVSTLILGLFFSQKEGFIYKFFNSKLLTHVGIISYSLYVWQEFAIYYIPNFALAIAPSYVLGILSFVLVEQSFEKIKKRILN